MLPSFKCRNHPGVHYDKKIHAKNAVVTGKHPYDDNAESSELDSYDSEADHSNSELSELFEIEDLENTRVQYHGHCL